MDLSFMDQVLAKKNFSEVNLCISIPTCEVVPWERCYDFKNIFAKKIGLKMFKYDSNYFYLGRKRIITIENCDYNIDPWCNWRFFVYRE
jgi:hypothetical protein